MAARTLSSLFLAALVMTAAPRAQMPGRPSSLVPSARTEQGAIEREHLLLQRVRETERAKVVFVGDSITQSWEGPGSGVWKERIAPLDALNLGNSGDRTEHVLWRLEQAPLTKLQPEHVVLLIGTNNLGHGTSSAGETLAGVQAVARLLLAQCPTATIHVLEVFPRGQRLNSLRGDVCQVNQGLRAFARSLADKPEGARLRVHPIGDRFLDADGAIDAAIMPDYLHLSARGYAMWADALVPLLQH